MTRLRSVLRHAYYQSGVRRAHLGAHRAVLRARSGAIRNDIGVLLHADPADERGALLAMKRGVLDRSAVAIWRRIAAEERPSVAIDVGANYGEVAFSTRYQGLRELHLVEPNPAVLHWLNETVRGVAGTFPPVVVHAGAASAAAGSARLDLDNGYSGTASLGSGPGHGGSGLGHSGGGGAGHSGGGGGPEVECFRLDERIAVADDDSLLFKVDVEGHELAALVGMSGLFDGRRAVGICEVLHADEELVSYLCDTFDVYVLRRGALCQSQVDIRQLRTELGRAREAGWGDLSKDVLLRTRGGGVRGRPG
jgi:FkbM family methyltransferase